MTHQLLSPTKLRPGDKVAVLSPAWAAPAYFPELHEQSLTRIRELLGLEVVEYPTTRKMGASVEERAADVNAAFADPEIRALFSTVGGDDQICLTALLDPELPRRDPKPFFGYSDNTNLLNWLWLNGVASYHGGATMVHLAPAQVDEMHVKTLRAALFGGDVEICAPELAEDFGYDWSSPQALTAPYPRVPAAPLEFVGAEREVRAATWGGCLEVLDQLALADRLPSAEQLAGKIIIFETSELLPPADFVGRWVRALGERGYWHAAAGIVFAQPVVADRDQPAPPEVLAARREAYSEYLLSNLARYNTDLCVCLNLPFGHTRPQAILPYGGEITLDPQRERVLAHY